MSAIWSARRELGSLLPLEYLEAFEVRQQVSCHHPLSIMPQHVVDSYVAETVKPATTRNAPGGLVKSLKLPGISTLETQTSNKLVWFKMHKLSFMVDECCSLQRSFSMNSTFTTLNEESQAFCLR